VDGVPESPTIRWPSDLAGSLDEFEWTAGLDIDGGPMPVGSGLQLTANFEDVGDAKIAIGRLEEDQSGSIGLTGSIGWAFRGGFTANSEVMLNLGRTTGDVVDAVPDPGSGAIDLVNRCDRPVRIDSLLLHSGDHTAPSEHEFEEPVVLDPGDETRTDPILGDHTEAAVDFVIDEEPDTVLEENRIDVERLEVPLTVAANVGDLAADIESLNVHVQFSGADEREQCELVPESESFAGVQETLHFQLPLDHYLAPEERTVEYDVTVEFETDRDDEHVGWQTHNLGDSGVLTLRADDLGLE
jgi:hypothetical protein